MPGVVRIDDVCSGHDCWPPRPSADGSPDVFVNNQQVERSGDALVEHCCFGCHGGTHIGERNVLVNNSAIQVQGDPIDCGSVCDQCSSDVFAG